MQNDTLLRSSLEVAVPLWIEAFKGYSWEQLQNILHESQQVLSEVGEAVLYRIEGKTAKGFNALARAIAVLSFVPGGIEIFGMKWESKHH